MEYLALVFLVAVIGLPLYFSRQRKSDMDQMKSVLDEEDVDSRTIRLLGEFPEAKDAELAVLVLDELVNERRNTPAAVARCTEYNVGRIRRTIMLTSVRKIRRKPKR